MRKPFTCYAVSRGRAIGVFDKWATCAAAVRGYGTAARYRGFYSRADAEAWLLDERAKLEEARQARRKKRGGKDTGAGGWRFVAATEPLVGPAVPEWPSTWQDEDSSDTDHNGKC